MNASDFNTSITMYMLSITMTIVTMVLVSFILRKEFLPERMDAKIISVIAMAANIALVIALCPIWYDPNIAGRILLLLPIYPIYILLFCVIGRKKPHKFYELIKEYKDEIDTIPESWPSAATIQKKAADGFPADSGIGRVMVNAVGKWFEDEKKPTRDEFLLRASFFKDEKEFVEELTNTLKHVLWVKQSLATIPDELVKFSNKVPFKEMLVPDDNGFFLSTLWDDDPLKNPWVGIEDVGIGLRVKITIQRVSATLPERLRLQHHHIVAGSGHGKTQCIQSMILDDLDKDVGIIVIDSQADLIKKLLNVVPQERLVHIDPTDKEFPISINVFDGTNDPDLYEYIFSSLDAEMTSKQSTVYRYLARLLELIPGATIHTMRRMLEPEGLAPYRHYIDDLPETAQAFFRNEFDNPKNRQFTETKQQILRRLYTVLENETFANMFSAEETKIDIGQEMAEGKVILIDTAKATLGSGFSLFGRFWIAQIAKAVFQNRAGKKTYLYIDEAHEYFSDESILVELFTQARKFNVGLIIAHQYIGQLPSSVAQAVASNTAIKFAGGTSAGDTASFAREMKCDKEFIEGQKPGSFAAFYRGIGTLSYSVEFGRLEKLSKRSEDELQAIRDEMRAKYCRPLVSPVEDEQEPSQDEPEAEEEVKRQPPNPEDVEETGEW